MGNSRIEYGNGSRYEGCAVSRGAQLVRQGRGKLYYPNGNYVQGYFQDNELKSGFFHSKAFQYEGQFKNFLFHGQGRLSSPKHRLTGTFEEGELLCGQDCCLSSGNYYSGHFKKRERHGHGVLRYKNGDKYQGEFQRGLFQGKGRLEYSNGTFYEGDFQKGFPWGFGRLKTLQLQYIGHFVHGEFNGQAKLQYKNGDSFQGNFLNGLKHGAGVFKSGQSIYDGNYEFDYKNGKGRMTTKRFEYRGDWANNLFQGEGFYIQNSEGGSVTSQFKGQFKCGKKQGKGQLIKLLEGRQIRYRGQFKNDLFHGYGQLHYSNKEVYQGFFSEGLRHGQGTYTFLTGDRFQGTYQHDFKQGEGKYTFGEGSSESGCFKKGKKEGQFTYECGISRKKEVRQYWNDLIIH